jgi:hypothetical protein
MSAATDVGAEREIDLASLGRALVARWWIAVAGLVAGALLGLLAGVSGGSVYEASILLAPGQAFSPNGNSNVLTYLTSESAIQEIATSASSLRTAAAKSGMSVGQLRGHVTVAPADTGTAANAASRTSSLIQLTVQAHKPKKAEDAANALGAIVQQQTTSTYVLKSIEIYKTRLGNYARRITTLQQRIDALNKTLTDPNTHLQQLDRLVLVSELDQAQAAQGALLDNQTLAEQQLTLAQDVELTQVIGGKAAAEKSVARSRRNSTVIGAAIGLILGAIAAIVVDTRAPRARRA